MQSFGLVNWFRFTTIVLLSILTSMIFTIEDGNVEVIELVRTVLQGLIAGFAFLQCPESSNKQNTRRGERQ